MLDILLHGGRVVDGTGASPVRANVGVIGDRIVYVGGDAPPEAARVIDVSGQVVAPGVIDIHSHSDFTWLEERSGRSAVRQGVTTEVVGNCGQSYAPLTELNRGSVSEVSRGRQPSVDVTWRTVGEYLAMVRQGNSQNCYFLVGHGTLRGAVVGPDDRPATPGEIGRMQAALAEALSEGARGMSTGLEFMPGSAANADELGAMAEVVGRRGGFLASHIRNRDSHFVDAVDEMIGAARRGGTPLQLSHLMVKPGHAPNAWETVVEHMQQARANGVDVVADMIPYDTGPGLPTAFLPAWALEGGPVELLARLRTPDLYARIRLDYDRYWRFVAMGEWDRLSVAVSNAHPDWIGQNFDDLAEQLGMPPIDVLLSLLLDEGEGLGQVLVNGRLFSEDHVRACLSHPLFILSSDGWRGTRDGGPGEVANHPNCWGWVPRILGHYVRDEASLSLEEAIHKMTSLPAQRLGLTDRGVVRTGFYADLMVFDPATVDTRSNFARPARAPDGISHVLVNGQPVVAAGEPTGALPGRVL
ncbi:MAG: D-aminoacylase [Chloroflexota bacterium]|nr:D-aminoacylase [Chloroflexota bacterium]